MSFLKLASLASFTFLFLGNAHAECVDLSGNWKCSNGKITTISKISDEDNLSAYTQTLEINGVRKTFPLVNMFMFGYSRIETTCSKNQIVEKFQSSSSVITAILSANLDDGETTFTLSMEILRNDGVDVLEQGQEMSCDRI